MAARLAVRVVLAALVLPVSLLLPAVLRAQGPAAGAIEGAIGASAEVLSHASFEGGAERRLSISIRTGEGARVEPGAGVRTRMTYAVATLVRVTATRFAGPAGATIPAALLCARGEPSLAGGLRMFDCDAGYVARSAGAGGGTLEIGVGATVTASATTRVPDGVYTAVVTLVATQAGS